MRSRLCDESTSASLGTSVLLSLWHMIVKLRRWPAAKEVLAACDVPKVCCAPSVSVTWVLFYMPSEEWSRVQVIGCIMKDPEAMRQNIIAWSHSRVECNDAGDDAQQNAFDPELIEFGLGQTAVRSSDPQRDVHSLLCLLSSEC